MWGLVLPRKNPRERLFDAWLLGQAVFLVVVARGNYVHEYYQLPLLFTLVFYIARVCARFARWPAWHSRQAALVGLALLVMSVATVRQLHRYFQRERPEGSPQIRLATQLSSLTKLGERLVVLDNNDPTSLYLADRKGWHAPSSTTLEQVVGRAQEGASLFAGQTLLLRKAFHLSEADLFARFQAVYRDNDIFVLRLSKSVEHGDAGL